jgi:hypothetical protein
MLYFSLGPTENPLGAPTWHFGKASANFLAPAGVTLVPPTLTFRKLFIPSK